MRYSSCLVMILSISSWMLITLGNHTPKPCKHMPIWGTGSPLLVRGRASMTLYLNLAIISLSAVWLYRDYLFTLFGFSHFQHLLPGQVASCLRKSCLRIWRSMASIFRASPPCRTCIINPQNYLSIPAHIIILLYGMVWCSIWVWIGGLGLGCLLPSSPRGAC
jgi:hypothetical protein